VVINVYLGFFLQLPREGGMSTDHVSGLVPPYSILKLHKTLKHLYDRVQRKGTKRQRPIRIRYYVNSFTTLYDSTAMLYDVVCC
jgi:hypothetical protein